MSNIQNFQIMEEAGKCGPKAEVKRNRFSFDINYEIRDQDVKIGILNNHSYGQDYKGTYELIRRKIESVKIIQVKS